MNGLFQGGPKIRKNDITYNFFFLRGSGFDLPTYRGKLPYIDVKTAVSDDFLDGGPQECCRSVFRSSEESKVSC